MKLKPVYKYLLRALTGIAALFLLLWLLFSGYILLNKQSIIIKVKTQINNQISGSVEVKDLETSFFRTFPNISVLLKNVTIRDSLWPQHHHDFVKAEKIYVRLNAYSLVSGKPAIGKVIVENATIHLFTDSTGASNLVNTKKVDSAKKKSAIPDMLLKNCRFVVEDNFKNKFHDVAISRLQCDVDDAGSKTVFNIKLNSVVHSLAFNTLIGSYLTGKTLDGKLRLILIPKKEIQITSNNLKIQRHPFSLNAKFIFSTAPGSFSLAVRTKKIKYIDAVTLLTKPLQQKLKIYNISKPFDITASLNGILAPNNKPLVQIGFEVDKADVSTPSADFQKCSFTCSFTNQLVATAPRDDANSKLTFKNIKGRWQDIPFEVDVAEVVNLKNPLLACHLQSSFALKDLNQVTGSSTTQFSKGKAEVNVRYTGYINQTSPPAINGIINMKDAQVNYLPRGLAFTNCDGIIEFRQHDLHIKKLNASINSTRLAMNGAVKNFLALLDRNPEQLTLQWNIATPQLNLNQFLGFLKRQNPSTAKTSSGKSKLISVADKIDRMLQNGKALLNVRTGKLNYKKFTASNAQASVWLLPNQIVLNEVRLNHAGGLLSLRGALTDAGGSNPIRLNASLVNVDIPSTFHAFGNFGQDAIMEQNIRGRLTADVNLTGAITDAAAVVSNSLAGQVNFSVVNGELINFEPLAKISETAFKKRDFRNMRFAELKNTIQINGTAIRFNQMEIRSNVFAMFVEGVYDTKRGTDMSIQIPLSNIKKPDSNAIVQNKGKVGARVRLRAFTGADGKLKVAWDPFNKAAKTNVAQANSLPNNPSNEDTTKRRKFFKKIFNKKNREG